jgi:hypothetical protein
LLRRVAPARALAATAAKLGLSPSFESAALTAPSIASADYFCA